MKHFRKKPRKFASIWLDTFLMFSCCLAAICAYAQENETSQVDEQYLKEAGKEWDGLFNSGQIEALAALYSEDVISMPSNAPAIKGSKALKADFAKFFAENTARHETYIDEILRTDEFAIERARYVLTYRPKGGEAEVVETGRHVVCRKKRDGKWQIAWEIWNTDQPAR